MPTFDSLADSLFSVLRLFALVAMGHSAKALEYEHYVTCMCNVLVACTCFIDYWFNWYGMVSMFGLYVFRNDIVRLYYLAMRYDFHRFVKRHVYSSRCRNGDLKLVFYDLGVVHYAIWLFGNDTTSKPRGSMDGRLFRIFLTVIMIPVSIAAPCSVCFGQAVGCSNVNNNDPNTCPWRTQMADNAAAVSAAVGGAIVVTALLTPELLRLFSPTILDTLAMVVARPKSGQPLDLSTMEVKAIQKAVLARYVSKGEAVMELTRRVMDASLEPALGDSPDQQRYKTAQMDRLKTVISTLGALPETVTRGSTTEGAHLFVLAKLSTRYCIDKVLSFDLCGEAEEDDEGSSSKDSSSGGKTYSAKLTRPRTRAQCYSLIHNWCYVVSSVGLAHPIEISRFVDEVFMEPLRNDEIEWPVAFELILVYLRLMESRPAEYRLMNVVSKSGGMDSCRSKATAQARSNFSSSCFRARGGIPGDVKPKPKKGDEFKGSITRDTPSASQYCKAYNEGLNHLAKHVGPNGVCRFKHLCNHYVTGKGKAGRCNQAHSALACSNPNRCDEAADA